MFSYNKLKKENKDDVNIKDFGFAIKDEGNTDLCSNNLQSKGNKITNYNLYLTDDLQEYVCSINWKKKMSQLFHVLFSSDTEKYLQEILILSSVEKQCTEDLSLTYGGISFNSFYQLMQHSSLKFKSDGIFLDLGSADGQAVLGASLTFPFSKCIGIELISELHTFSQYLLGRFDLEIRSELRKCIKKKKTQTQSSCFRIPNPNCDILFKRGNFLDPSIIDLGIADVIFICSTAFTSTLMNNIAHLLAQTLRPEKETIIISLSVPLPTSQFVVIDCVEYMPGWGALVMAYFQKLRL